MNRVEDALAATGFPSRRRHQNVNVHFFYQLSMLSHGVRRPGAAALDLAYVACGRLDLFWEFNLHPWDIAAGILLIREAGGLCTDMFGAPLDLRGPHVLADNGLVHDETVALFAEVFAGRYRHALPELPVKSTTRKQTCRPAYASIELVKPVQNLLLWRWALFATAIVLWGQRAAVAEAGQAARTPPGKTPTGAATRIKAKIKARPVKAPRPSPCRPGRSKAA